MSKSKKLLYISTLAILILLIVCTFLSKSIAEAIMPVVEAINPVSMEIIIDETDMMVYDTVIPSCAVISNVENKKYVYIVRQRKGLFGPEHYAVLLEVSIIAADDIYTALGGWSVTIFDDIIISSSRYLTSGEVVKVINK